MALLLNQPLNCNGRTSTSHRTHRCRSHRRRNRCTLTHLSLSLSLSLLKIQSFHDPPPIQDCIPYCHWPSLKNFLYYRLLKILVRESKSITMASKLKQMSKKRKFVADGVFYAELNELLIQELGEDGYAGVDLRVTPVKTEIVIRATRTRTFSERRDRESVSLRRSFRRGMFF